MRASYKITLVVMTAAVILFTALACGAAEEKEERVWRGEGPGPRGGRFELTDEAVENMMERLKEANPERAEALEKLREKEPEQFKAELREIMREHFAVRSREGRDRPERGGEGHGDREREMTRDRTREGLAELLEWLEKNYPEEASELAELKETEPELYRRQLWLSWRRYRRIAEAERENPQLAEVLKQDLELKRMRDKILRKIKDASEDEKKELVKELQQIVSSRFDLLVRRKQIAYEQLLKELEELKERVKKSEAEVEKWQQMKSEKVKERLGELINRTEKFRWE